MISLKKSSGNVRVSYSYAAPVVFEPQPVPVRTVNRLTAMLMEDSRFVLLAKLRYVTPAMRAAAEKERATSRVAGTLHLKH